MPGSGLYSIDTSALINWGFEDYSPDVLPGLLPRMEALIAEGRLKAARSVRDEILPGDLLDWCKTQPGLFVDEDEIVQQRVAQLMATYQSPKKKLGIAKADPFVIALADVMSGDWTVVSAEKGGSLASNPKIPIVCADIGLCHVRFFEMMRMEGWQLA